MTIQTEFSPEYALKEFRKSVPICPNYIQKSSVLFLRQNITYKFTIYKYNNNK